MSDEWIVKVGTADHKTTLAKLQQMTKDGRVKPGYNIFHPLQQRWIYAKDVAELAAFMPVTAGPVVASPAGPAVVASPAPASTSGTPAGKAFALSFAMFLLAIGAGMFKFSFLSFLLLLAAVALFITSLILYVVRR